MNRYDHYSALLNQYDKELDEIYHKYALQSFCTLIITTTKLSLPSHRITV